VKAALKYEWSQGRERVFRPYTECCTQAEEKALRKIGMSVTLDQLKAPNMRETRVYLGVIGRNSSPGDKPAAQ
jgi:hypothetical protein